VEDVLLEIAKWSRSLLKDNKMLEVASAKRILRIETRGVSNGISSWGLGLSAPRSDRI
jgi:hypothetical protein